MYIEFGSFGYILTASVFRPGRRSFVTSKVWPAYAPLTTSLPATSVPFSHTSPSPTTPGMVSFAFLPGRKPGLNSVRNHHGSLNCFVTTGPRFDW